MAEPVLCPFCKYYSYEYDVQLHIEEQHTDDSAFIAHDEDKDSANIRSTTGSDVQQVPDQEGTATDEQWVRCTRNGCGEYVLLANIDEHLDFHTAVSLVEEENQILNLYRDHQPVLREDDRITGPASGSPQHSGSRKLQKRQRGNSDSGQEGLRWQNPFVKASAQGSSRIRSLHRPENPGRLGERELGPYAYEARMPSDVRRILMSGARPRRVNRIGRDGRLEQETVVPNETPGLIGALADLCALERTNEITYLCHSGVRHVKKLACDGNFCGYWNIQMLLTYVQHMLPRGPQRLPDVVEMQDLIEQAWDNDICAYGRVETGGVADTRKWIGTHEALALFTQIGVRVDALCFTHDHELERPAAEDLLDHVEALFLSSSASAIRHGSSCITDMPPLYFQRLGHSMTIVGLERKADGARNLLVFDPSFGTTEQMNRLLARQTVRSSLDAVLRPYRRSDESLRRWEEFEIIVYDPSTSWSANERAFTDGV